MVWGAPLNMFTLFSKVEDAVVLPATVGMPAVDAARC
jgi:hypothetical protein